MKISKKNTEIQIYIKEILQQSTSKVLEIEAAEESVNSMNVDYRGFKYRKNWEEKGPHSMGLT